MDEDFILFFISFLIFIIIVSAIIIIIHILKPKQLLDEQATESIQGIANWIDNFLQKVNLYTSYEETSFAELFLEYQNIKQQYLQEIIIKARDILYRYRDGLRYFYTGESMIIEIENKISRYTLQLNDEKKCTISNS